MSGGAFRFNAKIEHRFPMKFTIEIASVENKEEIPDWISRHPFICSATPFWIVENRQSTLDARLL